MVKSFIQPLGRWPRVNALLARLAGQLISWPAEFEMRFMKLHSEGKFGEMWDMLAEDAKRAWGWRETFIREMPRFEEDTEILDMRVMSVAMLDSWTDQAHERTYTDVARVVIRYRIRHDQHHWTFDRQVHLLSDEAGWRTLCYPTRDRTAVGR
jgi:hypothetical protein